jgi:MFS family permease
VFALTALGLSAWAATAVLLVAALLQAVGEMAQSAGAWQISFDLAPPDKHGQYQGLFGNGLAVARVIAPLLLTTLILAWGIPGWIVLGGVFLGTSLVIGPAVRWAERSRPPLPGSTAPARLTVRITGAVSMLRTASPAQSVGSVNARSMECADTAVTRLVRGSFDSNNASRSVALRAWVLHEISVPPDNRYTHDVSGRSASAAATALAASGVHCNRIVHGV